MACTHTLKSAQGSQLQLGAWNAGAMQHDQSAGGTYDEGSRLGQVQGCIVRASQGKLTMHQAPSAKLAASGRGPFCGQAGSDRHLLSGGPIGLFSRRGPVSSLPWGATLAQQGVQLPQGGICQLVDVDLQLLLLPSSRLHRPPVVRGLLTELQLTFSRPIRKS